MNLAGGRWLHGFDANTVARDMEKIGPVGLIRCLLGERRFRPSGPHVEDWNVAAHSLNAALIFLRLREARGWPIEWLPAVLCHDLAEAFVGDIPRPVKRRLEPTFGRLEASVQTGVASYFRLPRLQGQRTGREAAVKHCDFVALLLEAEEFGLTLENGPDAFPPEVVEDFRCCGGTTWLFRETSEP